MSLRQSLYGSTVPAERCALGTGQEAGRRLVSERVAAVGAPHALDDDALRAVQARAAGMSLNRA